LSIIASNHHTIRQALAFRLRNYRGAILALERRKGELVTGMISSYQKAHQAMTESAMAVVKNRDRSFGHRFAAE
jgi:uncharacterized membrane-anchored protein YhcB (DUF1043 family)